MPRSSTTQRPRNGKARAAGNSGTNGTTNDCARSEADAPQATGAIERVVALQTTLREAAAQATELVRLLKTENKQNRQLRSALSSLKELQPLEV